MEVKMESLSKKNKKIIGVKVVRGPLRNKLDVPMSPASMELYA